MYSYYLRIWYMPTLHFDQIQLFPPFNFSYISLNTFISNVMIPPTKDH